ncbi:hypothetical protein, partial [Nostoc sp. UCD120]|uniref:hypothetical protein n=2 Tax=unclassified Nostoc TaxID=2593658 RepID=UPI001C898299
MFKGKIWHQYHVLIDTSAKSHQLKNRCFSLSKTIKHLIRDFQLKKDSIPARRLRERGASRKVRRGARTCAPKNLEIIWSSLRLELNRLILLDVLIIVAFALCLMFRLDAILMFPLIPACLLLENYAFKKTVSSSMLYSFFTIIIFKAMQSQLPKIPGIE